MQSIQRARQERVGNKVAIFTQKDFGDGLTRAKRKIKTYDLWIGLTAFFFLFISIICEKVSEHIYELHKTSDEDLATIATQFTYDGWIVIIPIIVFIGVFFLLSIRLCIPKVLIDTALRNPHSYWMGIMSLCISWKAL